MNEEPNAAALYAERAVVGGMLMDAGTAEAAVCQLTEEDFSDEGCRAVFRTAAKMAAEGRRVDPVTIAAGLPPAWRGEALRAARDTPSISGGQSYIDIVKEAARRRKLLDTLLKAQGELLGGAGADAVSAGLAEALTAQAAAGRPEGSVKTAWEAMTATLDGLEKTRKEGGQPGITTGFADVDRKIGTFQRRCFYVLGARSGMGKTALLLCMARAAAKSGKKALVFSLEMPSSGAGGLATRLLSQEAQVSHDDIRFMRYTKNDLRLMRQQAGEPYMHDLLIDDRGEATVPQMRSVIRQVKPDIVFVDYLGLIRGSRAEKRYIEVDNISHDLKRTAKLFNIPVVALVQLNREAEARGAGSKDGRPTLAHIRESDAIVHDADAVMLLYRPSKYNAKADEDKAELIVAKNRQGKPGIVRLSWTGATMTFRGVFSDGTYPASPPAPPKLKGGYDDVEEL